MPEPEQLERIRQVERCAFRAWPAAEVQECGGWLLRFADGVTHRANSVWPNHSHGSVDLAQKLASVEAFYAARGRPAIFQMCLAAQPALLDGVLESRGYTRGRDTTVQVTSVAGIWARLAEPRFAVTMSAECDNRWLTAYRDLEGTGHDGAARRGEIMRRIAPEAAYAIAWSGSVPCAVGSAVRDDGWLGLFNLSTHARYRRQGVARAVIRALIEWAQDDASEVYLQVMHDNAPALALYRRLGFTSLYDYHYRWRVVDSG